MRKQTAGTAALKSCSLPGATSLPNRIGRTAVNPALSDGRPPCVATRVSRRNRISRLVCDSAPNGQSRNTGVVSPPVALPEIRLHRPLSLSPPHAQNSPWGALDDSPTECQYEQGTSLGLESRRTGNRAVARDRRSWSAPGASARRTELTFFRLQTDLTPCCQSCVVAVRPDARDSGRSPLWHGWPWAG